MNVNVIAAFYACFNGHYTSDYGTRAMIYERPTISNRNWNESIVSQLDCNGRACFRFEYYTRLIDRY